MSRPERKPRRPVYKCGCDLVLIETKEQWNVYVPKCAEHGEIIDYATVL